MGGYKPEPYQRPSVDLTPHGREWRDVEVGTLVVGDTVANFGKVASIKWYEEILLTNVEGHLGGFKSDEKVLAFVRR